MFDAKKTGEKIAVLRKEREMTQEQLAEKLGVSAQAVSKWENGHAMPEIALLTELAVVLECTVDTILLPEEHAIHHINYVHTLLPYQDVDPYTGAWWPRSMAFPAVMTALQLFMGLQERRNVNNHQVNDDQEYILQSGISTLAFGFSHYNAEFVHDCFRIYGLDYRTVPTNHKPFEEITAIIRAQIQKGYPVLIQDKSNNGAFMFVTGMVSNGQTIRAHEFIEGFDEKNCNMNPYDMGTKDNWLKPDMDLLLLYHTEKLSVEQACKNALYNYCLMMSGKWDKEEFCSTETPDSFRQFMGYGSAGYCAYIYYLQRVGSLEGFYPQQAILHESHVRTLGFLKICKELIKGIDQQSLNAAIDRYQVLTERSWEIINISWHDPSHTEPDAEKAEMIKNILIRCNEIISDAVTNIKRAIGFHPEP